MILAAVYGLWAFQRAFTGKPQGENAKLRDVSVREFIVVAPLLALSLFLGLYPKPALDRIEPSVRRAVADLERKTDYREPDPPQIVESVRERVAEDADAGEGRDDRRDHADRGPERRLARDRAGDRARAAPRS